MEEDEPHIPNHPNISVSNSNTIYFYDVIDDKNILLLKNIIDDMNYKLTKRSHKYDFEPVIHLHINSPGGSCFGGLHCYSFIKINPIPIYTYIDGQIASSATLMFLGGSQKYIYKTSFMLIHQLSIHGFAGKFADVNDEYMNLNSIMDSIRQIYIENGKIKRKSQIDKMLNNEQTFNYKQILEHGFADILL